MLRAKDHWEFSRGDLFHWVAVLDKFDATLERLLDSRDLRISDFDPGEKELVLGILYFSRLLVENCTNRNIYNSYDVFYLILIIFSDWISCYIQLIWMF